MSLGRIAVTENTPEAAKATWIYAHKQVKNARAFTEGWDAAQEFMRDQVTDLLERSGKERAELEARVEQLERLGEERAELEKRLKKVEIERDTWKKWCQQAERVVSRLEKNQLKGEDNGG
jgi:archaellum component FlaC